jgi:hypothetical protein
MGDGDGYTYPGIDHLTVAAILYEKGGQKDDAEYQTEGKSRSRSRCDSFEFDRRAFVALVYTRVLGTLILRCVPC